MPQKNKPNKNKKILENYRTRTQQQPRPTITYARYSVVNRPEHDRPSRAIITAGGDRIILDSGASSQFVIEPCAHE